MVMGFKQTEIGLIPEDWNIKELRYTATYRRGSFPQPYGLPKWYDDNNGMPFVQVFDVDDNMLLKMDTKQKISDLAKEKSVFVPKGTVILTIQGSIGRIAITQYDCYVDRTLLIFKSFLLPMDKWYFMYTVYQLFQIEKQKAPGGTIKTITKEELSSFNIPLPPTKAEQTAIATVLNDADALINALEKLIAKKKAIKQGAMQELLKPKAGWEETTILEIVENKKELFDDGDWIEAEHITKDGVRLIQTGNIGVGRYVEKENKKYIFKDSFIKLKCKELKIGDLLICRLAEPAGRACVLTDIGEEKIVTSVDVSIFRPDTKNYNRIFLSNIFSTSEWFSKVTECVGGTTHKRISRSALGKIQIIIPDIIEQNRITQILSDMDSEIEALEQKLKKQKQIKQGMMQVLLTGKVRLV